MRILILLSCLLSTLLGARTAAQAPSTKPPTVTPSQPPAAPSPPAVPSQPAPVKRRPPAPVMTPVTVTLTVTDKAGAPIGDVKVSASGDVSRETQTTAGGIARFLSVKPGDYRLRLERDGFIALERDITVKGGLALDVSVSLSPASEPPSKPPAPVASSSTSAPPGQARALSLVDFLETNHLTGRDPVRIDQLGCTASANTTLLQIRDDLPEKAQSDADEVLYVVAGEGSVRLGNKDVSLEAGSLAIVPRGTVRALTRKGKNPLMVLSVVSGPACTK